MGFLQRFFSHRSPTAPMPTNIGTGHSYMCECNACIDAFMEQSNFENYTSKGRPIPTWEEMMTTQREYNRLASKIGAVSGTGAMEDHKRIMRIMSGDEAEPD